ncbi:hypothetical protein CYMTET_34504 [Cymbomonas tetramitiformis]|uniref:Uncharacterized protein n=1 Tax=Cymbomonas tetramitiformis TaxID=36881 RepID=A0AAE0FBJ7_9CHLO|nr:hypothetical protein CYMTET_34504 [Cymbomonas tetramitiformis]|eukprot:gene5470-6631_t
MQKLTANDGSSGDRVGTIVALSGTHLVAEAEADDSYQGSVYVYNVAESGATFVLQKVTTHDGSSNVSFGTSVALTGTHLPVGANAEDSNRGSLYMYNVVDSRAVFVQKVTVNDNTSTFGAQVALSETHLVVGEPWDDQLGHGSGSVYVYSSSDARATLKQKITTYDGQCNEDFQDNIALSNTPIAVGAKGDGDLGYMSGSVYVYSVSDAEFTFVQKVTANDGSASDLFGACIALSETHLVVGAPYADDLGSASGSVYLYTVTDSGATFVQKITTKDGNSNYGISVALSGSRLVVGENSSQGSVHVYNVTDFGTTFVQKVTSNGGSSGDAFGVSVALSDTHLVVAVSLDDGLGSSSGFVYLARMFVT